MGRILPTVTAAASAHRMDTTRSSIRCFSSGTGTGTARSGGIGGTGTGKHKKFSPRRRPAKNYRPTKPRGEKYKFGGITFGAGDEKDVLPLHGHRGPTQLSRQGLDIHDKDESNYDRWEKEFGPKVGPAARAMRRQMDNPPETVEDDLRDMDYLSSAQGSTEALAYERRALNEEFETEEERVAYVKHLDDMVERQSIVDLEIEDAFDENFEDVFKDEEDNEEDDEVISGESVLDFDIHDPDKGINPNQKAYGEWGEALIRVDRNIKLWRGGRIQSYRALVIGGNLKGCGGFGTGKAAEAAAAVKAASRHCRRNVFFVDRYQNCGLTRDLVGKSNSCRVVLRATHKGLRGNKLCQEILKYFGITNATAKCVQGNRSQYNVVRATFKALATHESFEEISHKRGRRLVSIDRGRRFAL